MVGCVDHVHRFDMEKFYGSFAVIPGYAQSFRGGDLARCLFGKSLQSGSDCAKIGISGSGVTNRGSCDWLADYFGLGTGFQGSVTFKPEVKTFFIDFSLHVGLDEWVSGLWLRAWAPFVHTRWDLNACETITAKTGDYDQGYFTNAAVANSNLLQSAKAFFQEGKTPNLGTGFSFESLKSCRWGDCGCDDITENGLADLRVALGWNFFQDEDYHIGLGLIAAAPTGNRPEGKYLFEPMVGNGNHWEFGGLLTSHVIFWRSEDEEKHFGGYLDANITHLFKTRQKRCFDLCGKPMSRYMLAEKLGTPVEDLFGADAVAAAAVVGTAPSAQFKNAYAPVSNLTCSDVDVSVGVQADVVAMLNYTCGGFSFDLGYNLWARSCEKIEFDCECLPRLAKEKNTWALKGDARVYGFGHDGGSVTTFNNPIALSATQSGATICKGTNAALGNTSNEANRNFGVDNPKFAQQVTPATVINDQIRYTTGSSTDTAGQTKTSVNPVFLSQSDINLDGSRTKGLSHSVFAHFSYSWLNNEDWTPFLGLGAQAEFGSHEGDCSSCSTSCSSASSNSCGACSSSGCKSCNRCAVSQWSVFVKGGITFN